LPASSSGVAGVVGIRGTAAASGSAPEVESKLGESADQGRMRDVFLFLFLLLQLLIQG
jgi:hypothetical protein